jgi:raffinose synthase
LLKIWNMNKYTGVLGVYNCQGAAWNTTERKCTFHQTKSDSLTGFIRGRDVHLIAEASTEPNWNGDCAVYCHRSGELTILPYNTALPVSLKVLEHDIFTVTPIKVLAPGFGFAPLGLINMFNAGGAIEGLRYEMKVGGAQLLELESGHEGERVENNSSELVGIVHLEVKGCGKFGAFSLARPRRCKVDSNVVDFVYDSESGMVTLSLDQLAEEGQKVHFVEVEL